MDHPLLPLSLLFLQMSLLAFGGANSDPAGTAASGRRRAPHDDAHTFAALFALAQAAPGPNMMVISLIGWNVAGLSGAVLTMVCAVAPSSVLTFLVARAWYRFRDAPWRGQFRRGLLPVTAGLLLSSAALLIKATTLDWSLGLLTAAVTVLLLTTGSIRCWCWAARRLSVPSGWWDSCRRTSAIAVKRLAVAEAVDRASVARSLVTDAIAEIRLAAAADLGVSRGDGRVAGVPTAPTTDSNATTALRPASQPQPQRADHQRDHGQRGADPEVIPEADRRPRDAAACCTTIRLAIEPRTVKLPASVDAIAIVSHAVSWFARGSTNGFSISTAGTLLTRLDNAAVTALRIGT